MTTARRCCLVVQRCTYRVCTRRSFWSLQTREIAAASNPSLREVRQPRAHQLSVCPGAIALRCQLVAGIDVTACDGSSGCTALHLAASSGHTELLDFLLSLPALHARRDAADAEGCTALHHAAQCGQLGTMRLLLERGAVADARTHEGTTPLSVACGSSAALLLLNAHADLNVASQDYNPMRAGCNPMRTGCNPMRDGCNPMRAGCNPMRAVTIDEN